MTNYPEGYKSLTAAAFAPDPTRSAGSIANTKYRVELEAPEGPEMGDDTLGDISTHGTTLAEAAQRMAQLLYNFNWRGELIIADKNLHRGYITFRLDLDRDTARVNYANIEADFDFRERNYATRVKVDTGWREEEGCGCCSPEPCHDPSDPPAKSASAANAEDRAERLRERVRQEQAEFKDTDLTVNPYNTEPNIYTFARFEQSQATTNLMADWLEQQAGITTHLAGTIVRELHGEMSDPGTTYRQISEVGYRPLEDISRIEVEDLEDDMDLLIEVRKLRKH